MSDERILLSHGGGGKIAHELIVGEFLPIFGNAELNELGDSAVVAFCNVGGHPRVAPSSLCEKPGGHTGPPPQEDLAFTTDSFVVKPIFFPGGDIGRLAVCGTVNDLAVAGAEPLYVSLALIIEEGFLLDDLRRILRSVKAAADEAGVRIVCGDTKVVERGSADGMFITTSGVGRMLRSAGQRVNRSAGQHTAADALPSDLQTCGPADLGPKGIRSGDVVLVSGTLGDHAVAVLSARKGIEFRTEVTSDVQPINDLARALMAAADVRCMRDPTRGGAAAVLNELAAAAGVSVELDEEALPVKPGVRGACDVLGLDPLYAANEGKLIAFVSAATAQSALDALRTHPKGRDAAIIGRVIPGPSARVTLRTHLGGRRFVDMPAGEQLPRIC
jgi:hydrogenase expression/formation protein HypE